MVTARALPSFLATQAKPSGWAAQSGIPSTVGRATRATLTRTSQPRSATTAKPSPRASSATSPMEASSALMHNDSAAPDSALDARHAGSTKLVAAHAPSGLTTVGGGVALGSHPLVPATSWMKGASNRNDDLRIHVSPWPQTSRPVPVDDDSQAK